ncbi:hypothetical protein BDV29DRAFT_154872 [Aspergillus leporis]|uniref:Uncharacterized protein n=1 Tax=Aspergillus leporis TaxID=41062 RepID=A0A5N5X9Q0_9EURO|nr:hypothetical protein BDV29DRAFT_154872 [Aspergillus leporis]
MFGHTGTFLRLPCLEELSFIVDMGGWGSWPINLSEEPEDILDTILAGTKRIKKLVFEYYRNVCFLIIFDAIKLKKILDTICCEDGRRSLFIVLSLHDQKDWRMPQEYTQISGVFGSMTHFTKLEALSIQLALPLGEPLASQYRPEDVLPKQLEQPTCLSLHSYDGNDEAQIWDWDDHTALFQALARAALDSSRFPLLSEEEMDRNRKDDFGNTAGINPVQVHSRRMDRLNLGFISPNIDIRVWTE